MGNADDNLHSKCRKMKQYEVKSRKCGNSTRERDNEGLKFQIYNEMK